MFEKFVAEIQMILDPHALKCFHLNLIQKKYAENFPNSQIFRNRLHTVPFM